MTFPPLKHFGPLLVVWGAAMLLLFFIRDIGSSLMFFGAFLAVLYVATNRFGFVLVGPGRCSRSAPGRSTKSVGHIQDRVDVWLDPFAAGAATSGSGYQIAQGLFAQADGGLFGTGFGGVADPHARRRATDLIYAVIVDELGLAGACGLILVYLLLAARGFKTAMIARDSFSTLLAAGLTAVLALQVFVIVGGVTRVIPLTGVTLPFVSYGGSSILANFVLLALLLLVSDRARREARAGEGADPPALRDRRAAVRGADRLHVVLVGVRRRGAAQQARQPPRRAAGAAHPRAGRSGPPTAR